jgi:hypothetical protein
MDEGRTSARSFYVCTVPGRLTGYEGVRPSGTTFYVRTKDAHTGNDTDSDSTGTSEE